ncbi:hypothetical protein ZEAMMB73_Zm00001d018345 [Zea mays]|uniref:Uncharacterized protein n=1 Tax=Zea mays TaxID=4577 RepID=A0A1D6HMY8_MAIZE|nr:hypothetical protein ZEAMMB73_Zm00001d018345 [Zea mays]AQK75681.1 hypothetical protein ZEAMMB73_Zm00001d018345 [Zea mays]
MGAVLADAEALERADLILLRFGGDGPEEGDVIVGVEAAEVAVAGRVRAEHLHLVEEAVAAEQRVGHADAVRLHRVAMLVVAVAHLRVVEVADAALRPVRASGRQGVAAAAQHGKGCVSQGASTNFASINCSAQSIRCASASSHLAAWAFCGWEERSLKISAVGVVLEVDVNGEELFFVDKFTSARPC